MGEPIVHYWSLPRGPKIADDTINYISAPMIAMTLLMAGASVIGYLWFVYFTTVFWECDKAVETDKLWEIVSDMCFYIVILMSFTIYPLFIFRCYFKPIYPQWRWMLHFVAVNIMIIFLHVTLKEAYHSHHHLCENSHAKVEPCLTVVEHDHFHCNISHLSDVQQLWFEMHTQMVQPGIFLIVAEYMPLLFVLLLMVPVAKNSSSIHQLMAALYQTRTWILTTPHEYELLHASDFMLRKPSSIPAKITFCGSAFLFLLMFFRFGVLLNCLGRYPKMEWIYEGIAQVVTFVVMSILFSHCNFVWLKNVKEPSHGPDDEKRVHHLVHAKLDSLLLRIAFVVCILQISIASLIDMRLYHHKYISVLLKVPIIIAYFIQYILLTKGIIPKLRQMLKNHLSKFSSKREEFHWNNLSPVCSLMLTVAALNANVFEWNAQFLKRRFTVFFLKNGPTIGALHVAGAAISEVLYPALSFYHFHAALCWLTVFWRVLKCFKEKKEKEGTNKQNHCYRVTVIRF